jgi:hypothetical protein
MTLAEKKEAGHDSGPLPALPSQGGSPAIDEK